MTFMDVEYFLKYRVFVLNSCKFGIKFELKMSKFLLPWKFQYSAEINSVNELRAAWLKI